MALPMEQGSYWQSCYIGAPGTHSSGYATVRGALSDPTPSLGAVLDADDLCQVGLEWNYYIEYC